MSHHQITNHIKRTFSVTKSTAKKKKKNYGQRQEKDRIIGRCDRKTKSTYD